MTVSLFDKTISFLSKALDMMSLRHQLIASNIANQDTPGYKAREIAFREELESVLKARGPEGNYRTDPGHIVTGSSDISDIEERIIMQSDRGSGYDNNGVNVELEMAHMAENTIMYNAAAQIISSKLKGISYAIREGR